ncbi:MAG: ACT domain-containing protein [Spirochaetales bacterium]|jgi:hypothetical protein|nr:ACT domain-containing protein [Spirochaetales bacterium]
MALNQISVFLENKSGRLAELSEVLGRGGINLRAVSIADTADFGICRLIVSDTAKTLELLEKGGYTARQTEVVGIEVADEPGALAEILRLFNQTGVNIEYLYATLERKADKAVVIFKVDNPAEVSRIIKEQGLTEVASL